ncbi:unnamed protein product, partial [Symbiodinium pilosum]
MATVSTPPRASNTLSREMLTVAPAQCPAMTAAAGQLLPADTSKIQVPPVTAQPMPTPIFQTQTVPVTATFPQPQVLTTQCTQAPTFFAAPAQVLPPVTLQTPLPASQTAVASTVSASAALPAAQPCSTPTMACRQIPSAPISTISALELWGVSGALPPRPIQRQVSMPLTATTGPSLPPAAATQSAQAPARILAQEPGFQQACSSVKLPLRAGRSAVASPMSPVPEQDEEAEGPRLEAPKPGQLPTSAPAILRPGSAPVTLASTENWLPQ